MKCKDLILGRLGEAEEPLAVHEMKIEGYSENNVATRLSELAPLRVYGGYCNNNGKKERFKRWVTIDKKHLIEAMQRVRHDSNGQGVFL